MKKNLFILIYGIILASTASADMTRVEIGTGAWMQTSEGKAGYSDGGADGSYTSNESDNTKAYIWALIKHPLPVLPNLRLEYVSLEDEGLASGKFKDFTINAGVSASMSYSMRQYDIIPYYNILDNTAWTTLDLGFDIKVIDLSYDAAPSGVFAGYIGSDTIAIPLLYLRCRVEIPATDIGLEADIKYVTTGDSTVYDFRAKVDYTLGFMPLIQPAIEIGYRVQKIDIDENSLDTKVKLKFSGVFTGLMLRF